MKLQGRLKEIRRQHDMTLLQVAKATDLSVSYLSDLERGRTNPSLDTLQRLAMCFGLSTMDLLAGVDGWGTPSAESLAPGLSALMQKGHIDASTAHDLNRIELRGKRPQTEDEWFELYLYLKRMMKPYLPPDDDRAMER